MPDALSTAEKWEKVRYRVLVDGVAARKACREEGVSYNTYISRYMRKKKKPAGEAGQENPARETRQGSQPGSLPPTDAGGQPAQANEGNNENVTDAR